MQTYFPSISFATIYKNLKKFIDLKLIRSIEMKNGTARYDADMDPHHHIINLSTNEITDLDTQEVGEVHIPNDLCCNEELNVLQIGKPAPNFTSPAHDPVKDDVDASVSLSDYKGKWVLLFFYPLDFTFVCPTELIELSKMAKEFEENNCQIIAGSIDSAFVHQAWLKADSRLSDIQFPIIADLTKEVGFDYGCLHDDGMHYRGAFIIDPDGVLQSMTLNNLPVGRNPQELLRTLKAFQTGDLCPVDWHEGDETLGKA